MTSRMSDDDFQKEPKNNYTKKTIELRLFSILRHSLLKLITQMGLYCIKQLETTFHQFCEKPLHITFKVKFMAVKCSALSYTLLKCCANALVTADH